MGRTHGVHAEITTFGLKFALWFEEMNRNLQRFEEAAAMVETGKISGAVGTFATPRRSFRIMSVKSWGFIQAKISTQVLQRDRHAQYFATLALISNLDRENGDGDPAFAAARKSVKWRNTSTRDRRAPVRCRISTIRSVRKTCAAVPGFYAVT